MLTPVKRCNILLSMSENAPFNVKISIDASKPLGKLEPIWRFFGADEPNYAYMKDGRKLLGELGQIGPKRTYFRAHNLLCSGDGTPALKWGSTNAYTEDAKGNPIHDWTILDRIIDAYLEAGVKPYMEIGFMPEALSTHPKPYKHSWYPTAKYEEIYTGWAYPPRSYEKWGELVYQWATHCVEEYGTVEVEQWYWETWNEPNIPYWQGTFEEFCKLHDFAIAAVRKAIPKARVGGPDTAGGGGQWLKDFLEHCLRGKNFATGQIGTPTDFIAFHSKGDPHFIHEHVRMGIRAHLKTIDETFAIIASYPELKSKPIVIGESDPEGCAACQGPIFGYRNGTMYSSYTAASFPRKLDLARKHGVNLEGALTWAFEFEDQPYFAGFRALATNGIDLAVLNVFRMFGMMPGTRVSAESTHAYSLDTLLTAGAREAPDVAALAAVGEKQAAVLVWHYHDDDLPGGDAKIQVSLAGLPAAVAKGRVTRYLIDESHSNSYGAWKRMGSPQQPTPRQIAKLEQVGRLATVDAPKLNAFGEFRLF
jgi:xylan 1,4-beta-xylosidase